MEMQSIFPLCDVFFRVKLNMWVGYNNERDLIKLFRFDWIT